MEPKQGGDQDLVFNIEKIYIKDVSYEAPGVPQIFSQQADNKEVNVHLGSGHSLLSPENGLYEVVLSVTVTATNAGKNIFLVEIKQAGIFKIVGPDDEALKKTLDVSCPNILLPFVREAVNDFVIRGGFSQLLIGPVNFESIFEQKTSKGQSKAQS